MPAKRLIGFIVILAVGSCLGAQGQVHEYAVPGHGKLSLQVPEGWRENHEELKDPASVNIGFKPPKDESWYVQVTSVWLDAEKLAKQTPEFLKQTAQNSADVALTHAVEKTATLLELRGKSTLGYYYSLTDPSPPPDEYKYMTQGAFLTGEMLTVFTILHNDPSPPAKDLALRMFADATYSK